MTKDLFARVQPRDEVLAGALTEAVFAASLDEVVAGAAPATYQDPRTFFAGTHPSAGLRTLLNEALGRLSGHRPDAPSVIRLETSLGGGKTHNLIALYHAARGALDGPRVVEFMDPANLPEGPVEQVGVFVGTGVGATTFPTVAGVTPRSLWGYLALQLGGPAAYEEVRADDEGLRAPGAGQLKRVLGGRPSLVLIDEIARYYEVAQAVAVNNSTLAKQVNAFLMALMEAVDTQERAVLVLTTTGTTGAFGDATGEVMDALGEGAQLLARKEHVLHPSEEADLPAILSRRLFAEVDETARSEVGRAYAEAAQRAFATGADLPEAVVSGGWAGEVARNYPFHPALVRVLDKRLSTIPNFQRTRGALRLLARVVRDLWEARPEGTDLIHLHHIDLSDPAVAEELSSRLDRTPYEPVIRADIASQRGGEASHAEAIDGRLGHPYARRLATAIYLYSLTREIPGASTAELTQAVLAAGDDPNLITKSLGALEEECWYLQVDARGYRFSTEASLPRLIHEAEAEISTNRARTEATSILTALFKDGALKVRRVWENARVPDNSEDAWLVVLDWDDFGEERGVDPDGPVPAKVRELWEKTPAGGLREFRNRLVFLAPSRATHAEMVRAVRHRLALEALKANGEILSTLSPEKRRELGERAKTAELNARVAVCNHVNLLYVPAAAGLETVELDVASQGSVVKNQTEVILDRLKAMEKTLTAGDNTPDPAYVRSKLGEVLAGPQPTKELVRAFARRSDLKLVLDQALLVALVVAGVRAGVWEYHDPERKEAGWATRDEPSASIRLGEDTYLYPPGSAPAPAPLACPFCGTVHTGPCHDSPSPAPAAPRTVFSERGSAGAAFQAARAKAAEAGRHHLRQLTVAVDEVGEAADQQLARLLSVVPTSTLGATLRYEIDLTVPLGGMEDSLKLDFRGPANDYQPLRDALRSVLRGRQGELSARLAVSFDPPLELSGSTVDALRQQASDTGPAQCAVTLTTEGD
ncbi:MAG: DUF499 domain-containing protein [Actinomycetota bacterium]|nr:DUF499 domain-containing protein [Actinomycetota bacterium]